MAVPWGICPILREYGPVWGSVRVGRGPGKPLRFFAPSRHGCNPSYATDLVVCVALGCDMFDCVFPTRTAVRLWQKEVRVGDGWGTREAKLGVGGMGRMKPWVTPLSRSSSSAALWLCPGAYWEPAVEEEGVREGLRPHKPGVHLPHVPKVGRMVLGAGAGHGGDRARLC